MNIDQSTLNTILGLIGTIGVGIGGTIAVGKTWLEYKAKGKEAVITQNRINLEERKTTLEEHKTIGDQLEALMHRITTLEEARENEHEINSRLRSERNALDDKLQAHVEALRAAMKESEHLRSQLAAASIDQLQSHNERIQLRDQVELLSRRLEESMRATQKLSNENQELSQKLDDALKMNHDLLTTNQELMASNQDMMKKINAMIDFNSKESD